MATATRTERATRILGWVAIAWFGLAAAWGMFGVIGGGHWGAPLANAIAAENMIKFHIIGPYWEYTTAAPAPSSYYCHHPFGPEWTMLPLFAIFGHRDWIVFFVPAAMSLATAWLLYDLGKRAWGTLGGAATAAGFAIVPITLSYANFQNLEVITIFGCVLFFWGHARLLESWKIRHALLSALGALVATNGDWPGYVIIGVVLGWGMLRGFLLPRRLLAPIRFEPYARWWVVCATVAVGVGLFYVVAFFHWNRIDDLIGSANVRGGGAGMPLDQVLAARKHRIELMFPPPIILLGKLAAPLALVRFVVRRRDEEMYSLATLLGATVQYLGFKNGADVHVFWPHYYGLYFALAFGQVIDTLRWAIDRVVARWRPNAAATAAGIVGLSATALFCVALLPDAVRVLRNGRDTWGRFNEEQLRPETDEVRVLKMISPRLAEGAYVEAHSSQKWSWHDSWALHGLHRDTSSLPNRADPEVAPFWIGRASQLSAANLKTIAQGFRLEIYGDIVVVDRRIPAAPAVAYTFREREPNPLEWYFVSGVEPMVALAYDPYATWEWRTHLDQPAEIPTAPPQTIDEKRVAHNIAVASGDSARAAALLAELSAQLDATRDVELSDGTRMLGVRTIGGTSPRLEAWIQAAGPTDCDLQLGVRSLAVAKRPWSFIPPDTLDRDVSSLVVESSKLWRKGFLYKTLSTLFRRVSVEQYYGVFWCRDSARAPTPVGRSDVKLDLATLP